MVFNLSTSIQSPSFSVHSPQTVHIMLVTPFLLSIFHIVLSSKCNRLHLSRHSNSVQKIRQPNTPVAKFHAKYKSSTRRHIDSPYCTKAYLSCCLVIESLHHIQRTLQFLFGDIAYTDTFTDFSYQRNTLFSMTMLNSIFATLPGKFKLKI